jgi:hypothetical protein
MLMHGGSDIQQHRFGAMCRTKAEQKNGCATKHVEYATENLYLSVLAYILEQ